MAIVMMINLKGGVAKTTSAVAIAECMADNGYRTLVIDADHQCYPQAKCSWERSDRCGARRNVRLSMISFGRCTIRISGRGNSTSTSRPKPLISMAASRTCTYFRALFVSTIS